MMHDCRLLLLKILVALHWVSIYDFKYYIVMEWLEFIVRLCVHVLFCLFFILTTNNIGVPIWFELSECWGLTLIVIFGVVIWVYFFFSQRNCHSIWLWNPMVCSGFNLICFVPSVSLPLLITFLYTIHFVVFARKHTVVVALLLHLPHHLEEGYTNINPPMVWSIKHTFYEVLLAKYAYAK